MYLKMGSNRRQVAPFCTWQWPHSNTRAKVASLDVLKLDVQWLSIVRFFSLASLLFVSILSLPKVCQAASQKLQQHQIQTMQLINNNAGIINGNTQSIVDSSASSLQHNTMNQMKSSQPIANSFITSQQLGQQSSVGAASQMALAGGLLSSTSGALPTLTGAQLAAPRMLTNREIEKQIVDRILGEGYDKRIRPAGPAPKNNTQAGNIDGPTIVKVNTLVRSISKIDDVTMEYSVQLTLRQEWTDDRLAFRKMDTYKNYTNLNSITLTEQERIWKPDLFFRNEKEGHFHKIIMPNVLLRIKGEGQVLYSIRISLVLACPMDLKYYPLDKQNCTIEMASYGYLEEDLKFIWKEKEPVQIAKPLNLPRFTLETYDTAYCTSRTTTGAYSCLRIDLVFKREFSYYLIQIYIPCCMLVIVSWVSFWLDPNAIPARVSLGVTTLLTMATQISGINASLPPVSYTKAIDVWTGVCLTFVFGALLEFALVNYASRSDQHKREMLTSALTHTQQMRWREATAAAAAAGVAPPTSPPPDENSPSMLISKQVAAFFGPGAVIPPSSLATIGNQHQQQQHHGNHGNQQHQVCSHQPTFRSGNNSLGRHTSTNGNNFHNNNNNNQHQQLSAANAAQTRPISTLAGSANGPQLLGSLTGSGGAGAQVPTSGNQNKVLFNQQQQQQQAGDGRASAVAGKLGPQINCALQYLRSPREVHISGTPQPKRKNWCKMWLAKFPTRSKRIDVISRIFFPLKFALFNLVYWTTYLFREEDTTY